MSTTATTKSESPARGPGRRAIAQGQRANLRGLLQKFPHVKTIEDATEPITVNVTRKDQKGAKPWAQSECAMARACKRERNVDGAYVQLTKAYLISEDGTHATRYEVPESVAREVVSFDRHTDFAIGTYRLSAIPPRNRLGKGGEPRTRTNGKTKQKALAVHRTARVRS